MPFERILITGGAGFIGSSLALRWKRRLEGDVLAVDSLKRRGSEHNLARLREAGVKFQHVDVRCAEDLDGLPPYDLLIDCSAEPSVHSGLAGDSRYLVNTNLLGTINCIEAAAARRAAFLFLSTSRVYPIAALNSVPCREEATRFCWDPRDLRLPGISERGVSERFPMEGARSLYGASKLACELLIREFVQARGLKTLVNRCGLISGPWQLGKVDQGVVALWVARHHFAQPLKYLGYGGRGKQVRDVLHVDDLFELLVRQSARPELWDGRVYNVGGGPEMSVSLCELTALCRQATGNEVPIASVPETSEVDVRIYITDTTRVQSDFDWRPARGVPQVVGDIEGWLCEHPAQARSIFGG
jgi:CDP-paratose 2-epimerase